MFLFLEIPLFESKYVNASIRNRFVMGEFNMEIPNNNLKPYLIIRHASTKFMMLVLKDQNPTEMATSFMNSLVLTYIEHTSICIYLQ